MEAPSIIVGRDRSHVRELIVLANKAEVISASAFFDKVRALAFLYDKNLRRDDYAPLIFAQEFIARDRHYPLLYARNCATLYSSLYHGISPPNESYAKLLEHNPVYIEVIKLLSKIDEAMKAQSLVNQVSALYRAWQIIEKHKIVPLALRQKKIALYSLIDLTALESEVIKSLARCGISFSINFPFDFEKRSFNIPVDYAARPFEREHSAKLIDLNFFPLGQEGPLEPLVNNVLKENKTISLAERHCTIHAACTIDEEACLIAQKIAYLKRDNPEQKVALVVRTIDERSEFYKRTLLEHNISVRDRKGIPLSETAAGIFLSSIFSACESSLSRKDFLSLICHPLSLFEIDDIEKRGQFIKLIDELGIDECVITAFGDQCRYTYAFASARKVWSQDSEKLELVQDLSDLVAKIKWQLSRFKSKASLKDYLEVCIDLIAQCFKGEESSIEHLLSALKNIKISLSLKTRSEISFSDFKSFLINELKALTIAYPDVSDVYAVEFLMLPELLGRKFDHIFIADISFGRMPQNITPDPLLSDEYRIHINKLLKKDVLKIFFDDPFEPMIVPPRQALEPFWFVSAIAAAQSSVHFSYAKYDHNNSEQAPSEFFLWLQENVEIKKENSLLKPYVSHLKERFYQGQKASDQNDFSHTSACALKQRREMFHSKKADEYAGAFNPFQVEQLFLGRIGDKSYRALTPTLLESFSECAFYGFFHRILKLERETTEHDEADFRALGQIAHQTLQFFYENHDSHEQKDLEGIIQKVSADYLAHNYVAQPEIFYCQIEGLKVLLQRLIEQLALYFSKKPIALEIPFGLGLGQKSVPINTKGKKYYLGGVIDRIDKLENSLAIIDYKLSSIAQLRINASESTLFKTNFQIPVYIRLAASKFGGSEIDSINFSYASIRDGKLMKLSLKNNEGFMRKILNDNECGGLADAIGNIISPIEEGKIIAQAGSQCTTCHFQSMCRKSEV
ncbi:MAG: PD-(D/E)XK nuclease family protein [Myxococcales bacterium]|nr:PD-(D/E)XK nuclease family protein [Myxococcales bacterium]USN51482.1 MAG: PD-(D/E)XK nuclease family protein [Myxococcales bacterium]